MSQAIRINKYMPIALVYFFFNSFLLPLGLLYTAILSPFFLVWLAKFPSIRYIKWFFIFSIPFALIHFWLGVDAAYYFKSLLLLFSVFIFCLAFYQFLKICHSLGFIFRNLVILNFVFTLIAIIVFLIPAWRHVFWTDSKISVGIEGVERLRLFSYEPSYYSLLMVPLALYYYLKALMNKLQHPMAMMVMVSVPIFLSFSFGVILAMVLSLLLLLLFGARYFFTKRKVAIYIIVGILVLVILLVVALLLFPENVLFHRISNVFSGNDTSFRGRTYDSFYLGWKVAKMKSIFWGAGLGQTKLLGQELWNTYYQTTYAIDSIAIPNAVGETLATFGIVGLLIRFLIQIVFFFRTKVYSNFYRLAIFIFVLIYQFTGSFIFNIAEYVLWILAFSPVFEELDKKQNPVKSLS